MTHETKKIQNLVLYYYPSCYFCAITRQAITQMGLEIELKDVHAARTNSQELVEGGGKSQVPCLRIAQPDGSWRWLYESQDIIDYLRTEVA